MLEVCELSAGRLRIDPRRLLCELTLWENTDYRGELNFSHMYPVTDLTYHHQESKINEVLHYEVLIYVVGDVKVRVSFYHGIAVGIAETIPINIH